MEYFYNIVQFLQGIGIVGIYLLVPAILISAFIFFISYLRYKKESDSKIFYVWAKAQIRVYWTLSITFSILTFFIVKIICGDGGCSGDLAGLPGAFCLNSVFFFFILELISYLYVLNKYRKFDKSIRYLSGLFISNFLVIIGFLFWFLSNN